MNEDYANSDIWAQQEQERQAIEEAERKKREERNRQMIQGATGAQQAQGGIDPGTALSMYQSMVGGGATSGASTAAGGMGSGAAAGSGGGAAAGGISAWPVAVGAAILAQHMWARNKGIHDDKDALLGRALYKDVDYYQPRLNEKVDGLGDEVKLAGLGSSPGDLFRAKTWSEAAKLAVRGGILGKAIKKIF